MPQQFVERLQPVLIAGDLVGAKDLLESLTSAELAEARAWFASGTRWFNQERRRFSDDRLHEAWLQAPWIWAVCAVHLCGPVTAAGRVPWDEFWRHDSEPQSALFIELVCAKGRDWAAEFVAAASSVPIVRPGWTGDVFTSILRTIGGHHHLPCPTGASFYERWLAGCPEATVVEAVANDPWMPELLEHYLDHGGTDPQVLEAIPEWIRREVTTRDRLLTVAFSQLVTPRRPGSQIMLTKILALLDFQLGEVPGGLDYLLGAIATVAGPAGKVLLPPAIELVTDGGDLQQLASVIAARSEKAQKKVLLAALTTSQTGRVSELEILAALELLADDPDLAFAEQVRATITKLRPGQEPMPAQEAPRLGLWELTPTPLPAEAKKRWDFQRFEWPEFLVESGRPKNLVQTMAVDDLLSTLAEGYVVRMEYVTELTVEFLHDATLVLSRFTNLLPDLFLGGGMRHAWPAALVVADAAAGLGTTPPSLADLLRTMASFAAEAPSQELPEHLAELAARPGKSKAQTEARNLAAVLASPRTAPAASTNNGNRGLWSDQKWAWMLPEQVALDSADWDDDLLLQVLSTGYFFRLVSHYPLVYYPEDHRQRKKASAWTPERALSVLVRVIHAGRGELLRTQLLQAHRQYEPQATIAAIDLWATGRLDATLFWRLARSSQTRRDCPDAAKYERGEEWGRIADLPGFAVTLAEDETLVLPEALDKPAARLSFLRACETLLLADRNPVVLALPTYRDGTLTLDDLLARLAQVGTAPVGMLDLVQALYRLREVDPARAGEIPSGRWFTAAELTEPDASRSADAGDLLRAWVANGGLPEFHAMPSSRDWSTTSTGPIPWSFCTAAPRELAHNDYYLGACIDVLRTFPRWPDRSLGSAQYAVEWLPSGAHGKFGVPLHALVFNLMIRESADYDLTQAFADLFKIGRLDPATAVSAIRVVKDRHHELGRPSDQARLARGLSKIFEAGGLAAAWPTAVAIGVFFCRGYSQTDGAELLAMLAHYAPEVPTPRIDPAGLEAVRTFAQRPDNGTLTRNARKLLAALEEA